MLEDDIGRKEIQQLDFKDRKLLFNPNKNVGVYVENMRKIIFPIVNEKRGMIFRCVLLCAIVLKSAKSLPVLE